MKKVMLVEDEELILMGIHSIIDWESLGMEVIHMAHNGREALDMMKEEPADIIVTDINMPVMDGLSFLKELRKENDRTRCILLTGYDEFEYARKAISLDVEDYILKPIDEEKLAEVLASAAARISEMDERNAADINENVGWINFLEGRLREDETTKYLEVLPDDLEGKVMYAASMKINMESMKDAKMTDILVEIQKEDEKLRVVYLSPERLLLLVTMENESEEECLKILGTIQNRLESAYGILSFIGLGASFTDSRMLPAAYQEAKKLDKYRIIEGYGSCIALGQIRSRKSSDSAFDGVTLRKLILQKNQEEARDYLEDLFISNVKKEADVDDLYQMCLKIALLLSEIQSEYNLKDRENMQNFPGMAAKIFQAEDLLAVKTMFISAAAEIITYLHESDSQYTPVVKQILTEVQEHYQEDMNLKTLSYKYHMNASYLGQIFQKEVGCSFAQYLSNTKNAIAKDMILNTNMKIHDIAEKVGYTDTSYFYRKFKQCYGVSPASLREMKKY